MQLPSHASPVAAGVRAAAAPNLRSYQVDMVNQIASAWMMCRNVLAVLPTGAGKTVTLAHIVSNHRGSALVGAHRKELLDQISIALARVGVRHRVIAPPDVIRAISAKHVEKLGVSYYDANAEVAVASVDSLGTKSNQAVHGKFLARVTLWVMDEAHHVLKKNKWGKALLTLRPDAYGLGVTATPCRADGMGLGAQADGLFHHMCVGPRMRDLIDWGFLTDADVVAPETHIEWAEASVSGKGDLVLDRGAGKVAVRKSGIVGDTVENYKRFAAGMLTVVFASDLDTAADIAARFRADGISAEVVDGETPGPIRDGIIRRFAAGAVRVLVNVDLFGEGFDLPAIECVIMARKTLSFSLYAQQWGRALRLLIGEDLMRIWDTLTVEQRLAYIQASTKPKALIIDQVGNLIHFRGPPTSVSNWTLARSDRGSRGNDGVLAMRACTSCCKHYERFYPKCLHCGAEQEVAPSARRSIETVEGDLAMLDPDVLRAMELAVAAAVPSDAEVRQRILEKFGNDLALRAAVVRNREHRESAQALVHAMSWWAGDQGITDVRAIQRKFWTVFGIDMLSAQGLSKPKMDELRDRIIADLTPASKAAMMTEAA